MTTLFIILWALAGWIALLAGLTTLFFFYENLNTYGVDGLRQRTGLSPGSQFMLILGLTLLGHLIVCVTFPLGWIRPLWYRPPAVATRQPGGMRHGSPTKRPPVLLVHGLYHNASGWLIFRQRLRAAGYEHVYAYSYSSFFQDFSRLTAKLAHKVDELRSHFPSTPIVLVGHSLGGLQVRAYMATEHAQGKVAAAVTLGAPHQGSKLAALGMGGLARSLAHRGELVQGLERADVPAPAPCLSLTAPLDEFVLPLEAATLPRAQELGWTEQCLPPTTHVFLLYDGDAANAALTFLDSALVR